MHNEELSFGSNTEPNSNDLVSHSPNLPAPASPSTLHRIFFGPEGLRSGWGLLTFILIFGLFMAASTAAVSKIHPGAIHRSTQQSTQQTAAQKPAPSKPASPQHLLFSESIPFAFVCLTTWIMSKLERRPIAVYGIGRRNLPRHFFLGLFWGVLCLSLLVFSLWKTHLLVFDSRLLFGSNVLRYGAIWLVGFFSVALFEEYLTRGYLQYTLTRSFTAIYGWLFKSATPATQKAAAFWTAAILFSLLFGLGHSSNPGESPIGLLSAGLAALVFTFSLWRTGSLWWAIGFHASWDWAQSFLYGVADSGTMVEGHLFSTHAVGRPLMSGGTTGPEGSIFILPILTLVAIIIAVTLPRTAPTPTAQLPPQTSA